MRPRPRPGHTQGQLRPNAEATLARRSAPSVNIVNFDRCPSFSSRDAAVAHAALAMYDERISKVNALMTYKLGDIVKELTAQEWDVERVALIVGRYARRVRHL